MNTNFQNLKIGGLYKLNANYNGYFVLNDKFLFLGYTIKNHFKHIRIYALKDKTIYEFWESTIESSWEELC
jgi:hypothetical protein